MYLWALFQCSIANLASPFFVFILPSHLSVLDDIHSDAFAFTGIEEIVTIQTLVYCL